MRRRHAAMRKSGPVRISEATPLKILASYLGFGKPASGEDGWPIPNPEGERKMNRLLAAALLLAAGAAPPAFACNYTATTSSDNQPSTVAAQPPADHPTPPPTTVYTPS